MAEGDYKTELVKRLEKKFIGLKVLKNDEQLHPGYPDLSLHFPGSRFALLEVKREKGARERPNQGYYIDKENRQGGFGRFIYPENESEVIRELEQAFPLDGPSRVLKSE